MKTHRIDLLLILTLVGIVCLSCGSSPEAIEKRDAFYAYQQEALQDGVIDQAEFRKLQDLARQSFEAAQQTDWGALIGASAATMLASFLGVNTYRNRNMPGTRRSS